MRISDWSSDVCSSDLVAIAIHTLPRSAHACVGRFHVADHVEFSGANCGFGELQVGVTACRAATPPIEQRQAQPQPRASVHAALRFAVALRADLAVVDYPCVAGGAVTLRDGSAGGAGGGPDKERAGRQSEQ